MALEVLVSNPLYSLFPSTFLWSLPASHQTRSDLKIMYLIPGLMVLELRKWLPSTLSQAFPGCGVSVCV